MKTFRLFRSFLIVAACWLPVSSQPADLKPTVILISFDGMRPDYLDSIATPHFDELIRTGVRAKWLIPAFPTKTFPNHYTIVTGLYPAHHGIISNTMWDPVQKATFRMSNQESKNPAWWWGEPVWVTAEQQGQISAAFFWPGTEVKIAGRWPTYWKPYDGSVPNPERVRTVLSWLDKPADQRPTFITLYFSDVDDAGHAFGPSSPRTLAVVQHVDSMLGLLLDGLNQRGIAHLVHIVAVSDHGMSALSEDRIIYLEDYIDSTDAIVVDWSPVLALVPAPEKLADVYSALKNAHPHLQVFRPDETPDRWHFRDNRRIMPVIGVADDGWTIMRRRTGRPLNPRYSGGSHGYDNALESMRAMFIARGPAFQAGVTAEPFENIHVYNLLCAILGLKPAPNDGEYAAVRGLLK